MGGDALHRVCASAACSLSAGASCWHRFHAHCLHGASADMPPSRFDAGPAGAHARHCYQSWRPASCCPGHGCAIYLVQGEAVHVCLSPVQPRWLMF